jgi:dynein heavy chain
MKRLDNTLLVAAMNPTAGSFFIIDRMQRHFGTFATLFPEADVLNAIYYKILAGHFASGGFADSIVKTVGDKNVLASKIVGAAIMLHKLVADSFLPTAVKFHYQWNLRELSRVIQGMLMSTSDNYFEPFVLVRLWVHESYRVYGDRLTDEQDAGRFEEQVQRCAKNFFEDEDQDALHAKPLAFTKFAKWTV